MSVAINKGVVPKDYTCRVLTHRSYSYFNTSTGDIGQPIFNISNLSDLPPYNMVAEIYMQRESSTQGIVSETTKNTVITWGVGFGSNYEIFSKYRYIRFYLIPNVSFENTQSNLIRKVKFFFSVSAPNGTYSCERIVNTIPANTPGYIFTLNNMAFIFDTKLNKIYDDTTPSPGTTPVWSSE